jgi:pentapeptide repeat protein
MKRAPLLWQVMVFASLLILAGLLAWLYIRPSTVSERKDFIQLIIQLAGGAALLVGLIFSWRNLRLTQETTLHNLKNSQETLRLAQESRIAERFSKAIEQIGSDKLEVRMGSIYSLEQIAKGSEADHWPIMEILTAYVRERAPATPVMKRQEAELIVAPDIQAVLTVLGRRTIEYEKEYQRLELSNTYLYGAKLNHAHLERANVSGTCLERAELISAHLEGANLNRTILKSANLTRARVERAELREANLEGADFYHAHLEGADLSGASLSEADLNRAHLKGADLSGIDLTSIRIGLTGEQISEAIVDEETKLPAYIKSSINSLGET